MANYPYMNYQQPYGQPMYQPVQMPQQQSGDTIRLVTSKQEVLSSQIPFDGSVAYFRDTSNGKIYTKAFDPNTGTAPIVTYVRETENTARYLTSEDVPAIVDKVMERLLAERSAGGNVTE